MMQVLAPLGATVQNMLSPAPSHPDLQMLPQNSIVGPLDEKAPEKFVLSHDAKILREELIGYVDAILERQDRADILKKVESFQIETASRRTMKELTDHFLKLDGESKKKISSVKVQGDAAKKKIETQELMIKKLQNAVQEIANMNKRLQIVE